PSRTYICFFCQHPATAALSTLSLHDALPILPQLMHSHQRTEHEQKPDDPHPEGWALDHSGTLQHSARLQAGLAIDNYHIGKVGRDRKSTRLNSSHVKISYAVFCLKKKKRCQG